MRELKFRAWVETSALNGEPMGFRYLDLYVDNDNDFANFSPTNIEQYTGLKDKNGKDIYEGDIVRTTDRVTAKDLIFPIGVVEFKQRAFWICNVPSERPDFTHNETLLQYWETDLEVIGNIHENPELLEGKKEKEAK